MELHSGNGLESNSSSCNSFWNSCSPFWFTSTLLSAYNGKKGRENQISSNKDEQEFQREIASLKEQHEDIKNFLETEFKRHLKEQQTENENIQTALKHKFDLEKDELKMFVKDWPLKLSLETVQEKRNTQSGLPASLIVIIAKHTGGSKDDILNKIYDGASGIVNNVQSTLKRLGIHDGDVLRFKEDDTILGGAALANIYSMLSAFPTVVIIPRIDKLNKRLAISVGCWFANSRIPSQHMVFSLEYDNQKMSLSAEYKANKQREIECCYTAIAAVMNDIYVLMSRNESPRFPDYAKSIGLIQKYPMIRDFMRNEYFSVIDGNQTKVVLNGHECDAMDILYSDKRKSSIGLTIQNILNSLN